MAPVRLARPPTAAHITISMEGTTPTRAGEIPLGVQGEQGAEEAGEDARPR